MSSNTALKVQTSRFGEVSVSEDDILLFTEGLLGFASLRRFILVDDPTDEIFIWLQSCEEPGIAFPVLEPELFVENYSVTLAKNDIEALQLKGNEKRTRFFTIITIPENPTQMTANMKAPVVVNVAERLARQCVLQDNSLEIREPIFTKLQQRMAAQPTQPIKDGSIGWDFTVKLPVTGSATPEPGTEASE